jgi:hypothetical protein
MRKVMARGCMDRWIGAVSRAKSARLVSSEDLHGFEVLALTWRSHEMSPGAFMGVRLHLDPNAGS